MPTTANIFYAERGDAGPALLCLHGAGGSHRHWGAFLTGLSDIARVYAVDLPGHGRSAPPGRSSIDDYVDFTIALLDALGLERAILAGHSMGGAIALSAAAAHPGRVSGLILVSTSARLRVLPALISGLERDPDAAIAQLVAMLYAAEAPAELRATGAAELRACDPLVTRDDFIACDGFDIRPRLPAIQAPALVIAGSEDRLVPPKLSDELVRGLPSATLAGIDGVGHMPMVERPQAAVAAARAWLAR